MPRLADLQDAYAAQQSALVAWLAALPGAAWREPSRLAGWTVRELAFHATDMTAVVVRALATGPVRDQPLSVAAYTSAWRTVAGEIVARDRAAAGDRDASAVLSNAAARAGRAVLDALTRRRPRRSGGRRAPRPAAARRPDGHDTGQRAWSYTASTLSASVPDVEPVEIDGSALGVACRMLAAILAERAPGRTVEVRVPPYAAVQCVDGPRHTRGTPANVVEVPARTWVELATGRTSWSEAQGAGGLQASGDRADLSALLPVLA